MKTLFIRSITGLVFGIVLIGLIYYSFDTFLLLLTLIVIGSFFELKNLFKKAQFYFNEKSLWVKSTLVFLLTIYPVFETNTSPALFNQYRLLIWGILFIIFLIEFLIRKQIGSSVTELAFLIYLFSWFQSALSVFYFNNQQQYHYILPLSVVFMIWANDTFAYFTGMLLGKNKLMPTVSPNKTVEGFLGGIIFAIITAYLCFQFLWIEWNTYDIKDAISIALIVSIVGTIGDLIESKIKRLAEVKDSGSIFPGHGGVLDRFDAWFLVFPALEVYEVIKNMWI